MKESMNKVYKVSWTIKLTRSVEANSKKEALAISEEMGFMGDEASFEATPMRVTAMTLTEQTEICPLYPSHTKRTNYIY